MLSRLQAEQEGIDVYVQLLGPEAGNAVPFKDQAQLQSMLDQLAAPQAQLREMAIQRLTTKLLVRQADMHMTAADLGESVEHYCSSRHTHRCMQTWQVHTAAVVFWLQAQMDSARLRIAMMSEGAQGLWEAASDSRHGASCFTGQSLRALVAALYQPVLLSSVQIPAAHAIWHLAVGAKCRDRLLQVSWPLAGDACSVVQAGSTVNNCMHGYIGHYVCMPFSACLLRPVG